MDIANWIAGASAVASIGSAFAAFRSAGLAKQTIGENRRIAEFSQGISSAALASNNSASETVKKMFQRQYIFELHNAWGKVRDVSKASPNAEDAVVGANTLSLTAAVWLHDVMDKDVLHQTYSKDYIRTYEALHSIEDDLPCMKKSGRELLTDTITRVFNEMKSLNDSQTRASTISS